MEAFEWFVAVALESEDFVVSLAIKFNVKLKTRKAAYDEYQSHGYEVDLMGRAPIVSSWRPSNPFSDHEVSSAIM
jgi:hypothetical protein